MDVVDQLQVVRVYYEKSYLDKIYDNIYDKRKPSDNGLPSHFLNEMFALGGFQNFDNLDY